MISSIVVDDERIAFGEFGEETGGASTALKRRS